MTTWQELIPDWLRTCADQHPDRIALTFEGRNWTFSELDSEAEATARRLAAVGVKRGDRVATLLRNGSAAAIVPHALLRLGATLVPLNTRLTLAEAAWQIRNSDPRLILAASNTTSIASPDVEQLDVEALREVAPADAPLELEHRPDQLFAIIHTSGTTGAAKGAKLTVGNFWWSALGSSRVLGVRDDDAWIACLPLFHVGGLSILTRSAINGTKVIVHDGFDPARVNYEIDRGATMISLVSVMLERLLDQRGDRPYPDSLRWVLLGGGPASERLLARCEKMGVPVATTYGLTETASQVVTRGEPLYPNEIRIDADERGEGEILVRGPIVMQGYINDPDATAKAFIDGWLRTGDIGKFGPDGSLEVLDRRTDLIVTGGENVYPAEVEAVLASHPLVVEAAVAGLPDETWGNKVVAVVRTSSPVSADELRSFCRESLAGYKVPHRIRFVNESLPRTASGKLQRQEVRKLVTPEA